MQSTKLNYDNHEMPEHIPSSLSNVEDISSREIRVYSRRWAIAVVLGVLIFSNSMCRIGFGPVAYTSAQFYQTEVAMINRFALVYMVVGIPTGFIATWIMNKIGLRYSLILAGWTHLLGSVLRVMSAIESVSRVGKLFLVFFGHILSAAAQPFLMFSPTQVSANWFPGNERSLANSVMSLSNPLGILAANILSPLLVTRSKDITIMLLIYTIPAALGAVAGLLAFRSDVPPIPPSYSAIKKPSSFWTGVRHMIRNRQYWILLLSIGGAIGIFTALTVFLEQILCPWGYSDFFAGVVCGSCLILVGIVGALIAGIITDRLKKYTLIAKLSFTMCVFSLAVFVFVQNRPNAQVLIALSCGLIGFFGLPLLPLGNEIIVETTYPAEPATSTGLVFLSGQLQGMLLVILLQNVARPLDPKFRSNSRCHVNESIINEDYVDVVLDMTIPCFVYLVYAALVCLCFVFFFRPSNNRINLEKSLSRRETAITPQKENRKLVDSNFKILKRKSSET